MSIPRPLLITGASSTRVPILTVVTAGLLSLAGSVQAQSINVPNWSFESPQVPAGFPAVTTIDSWEKAPVPPGFPPEDWNNLAGIFPNPAPGEPRHITNADGNQVAFLFVVQGVSISQDLAATFDAGFSYTLSLGLRGGGALTPGATFGVSLYYQDSGSPVTVAATEIVATADYSTTSELFDIQLTLPSVQATDPWAGQNIGIQLAATSNNGAPGIAYWEADRVSLVAVPEPNRYALLVASGFLGGVLWWRRHRHER